MSFISVTDVRTACGAPDSLATGTQIEHAIEQAEEDMAQWMNTKFTPTQKIDILDGNDTNRVVLRKNPVLSVRALKTNDTTITPSALNAFRKSRVNPIPVGITISQNSLASEASA